MIKLPKECEVDKDIPIEKIDENVYISNILQKEFVEKVDKIIWKYKIAENNINVSKTENVVEIEVFELLLKEKYNSKNILKIITKAIHHPILFMIKFENEYQYAIKFEENIYFSAWNSDLTFNFIGFNLEKVYENIVKIITNIKEDTREVQRELERLQEISKMKKEISKLENQIKKEEQFNKKVELNIKLLELKNKKEELENNE